MEDQTQEQPDVPQKVKGGGRGNYGRWLGDTFISADTIVEQVRTLLADSWTIGDIKRSLVKKFGGKPRSFEKHVAVARKRNRETIGRTREESKADSCQQWIRLMADERVRRGRAEKQIEKLEAKLETLTTAYDAAKTAPTRATAREKLDLYLALLDRAERRANSARHAIERHQHTLDRILGNLAPIEVDLHAKHELENPPEPLTEAEGKKALRELIQKVRDRSSTPSQN